ncbi:MAG: metal transporter [Armatimonadota bacterium]|nr:metal transporter [Armatimonadota bacterium]MDR7452711.1 metal transporter [Armatimonadota bacterium]MDR7465728.1 metal transporter [Armatimonadota bacterium]MDR7493636.1 metal transporter [Armatimonadota bacterium]MDR7499115.1 metal transporter [Armatimonadota bacterium]
MASSRRQATLIWAVLPLILLAVLVIVLLRVGPLGVFQAAFPPVEELTVARVALSPGQMVVHVTNGGPQPVTIAQVLVDGAYWQFTIVPGATVPRLGRATITLAYPWVEGEAHHLKLLTSTGVAFEHTVEVATASPRVDPRYLLTFTLLGVYVGVIPVFLGLLWLPFIRDLDQRWVSFFLALTAGLLLFLGVDALEDALEAAGGLPPAFQGPALVLLGILAAALFLVWVSRRLVQAEGVRRRFALALLVALGIGLHNLGEGLAIGAAYSLGKVALGTFLVIGFAVHNTTEGLAIVAPIARDHVTLGRLTGLGALAGLPTILGTWVGGLSYSPVLAVLFLALGAGAIFQVVYEIVRMMVAEGRRPAFGYQLAGFGAGLLVMYLTGLFVAA